MDQSWRSSLSPWAKWCHDAHAGSEPEQECNHPRKFDQWHTCTHPYHSTYSLACLPPLLFLLDAPPGEQSGVIDLLVENGSACCDQEGNPIRNFPFLPRYISTRVSGWMLEFWMRTDSRLSYRDIKARMTAPKRELPSDNSLNMRREREARTPLGLSCWTTRRGDTTKAEIERVERWSPIQLSLNTTMVIERMSMDDARKDIPVALQSKVLGPGTPRRYPLYFFLGGQPGVHIPGPRISAAIQLLYQLQDWVVACGVTDWRNLPPKYFPSSWPVRGDSQGGTRTKAHTTRGGRSLAISRRENFSSTKPQMAAGCNSTLNQESNCKSTAQKDSSNKDVDNVTGFVRYPKEGVFYLGCEGNSPASTETSRQASNAVWDSVMVSPHSFSSPADSEQNVGSDYKLDNAASDLSHQPDGVYQDTQGTCWTPVYPLYPSELFGSSSSGDSTITMEYNSQAAPSPRSQESKSHAFWLERTMSEDSSSSISNNTVPKQIVVDPAIQGGQADTQSRPTESIKMHRFNASGDFSVRANQYHPINLHTDYVMTRNDPFSSIQQPSVSVQRSFDTFVLEGI
ncbi:hypothetical protein FQN57_004114 [Myotisia sp. PD_48]|nr:hypothetical protein FQN57_004114 [Myotisia sp. PD_48]